MDNNLVLSDFQLLMHRITKLEVKNSFINFNNEEKQKDCDKSFNLSHKIVGIDTSDKKFYMGAIMIWIEADVIHNEEELSVRLALEGEFVGRKDKLNVSAFEKMLNINGVASLYSIARANITAFTSQILDGGSVILPMVNVVKYSQRLEDSDMEAREELED